MWGLRARGRNRKSPPSTTCRAAIDVVSLLVSSPSDDGAYSVADNLNVELVEILRREAVLEVGSYPTTLISFTPSSRCTLLTKRSLDENRVVQLLDVGGDAEGRHRLKESEGVATFQEIVRVPLVQRPRDQQHDLVYDVCTGQ